MNKNELAVQMVKDSSITKSDAIKVIDGLVDVITAELKRKDAKITLVGFGSFKTIEKKQKKGRNPRTGAVITIPRKKVVKFVAGKQLKDIVK